jgi:hypothetical protein
VQPDAAEQYRTPPPTPHHHVVVIVIVIVMGSLVRKSDTHSTFFLLWEDTMTDKPEIMSEVGVFHGIRIVSASFVPDNGKAYMFDPVKGGVVVLDGCTVTVLGDTYYRDQLESGEWSDDDD